MLFSLPTYSTFEGRIGRQTWWLGSILLSVAFIIPYMIAMAIMFGTMDTSGPEPQPSGLGLAIGGIIMLISVVLALWGSLALQIKRWHDRDKSGWWVLIGFVPVIGSIWALV